MTLSAVAFGVVHLVPQQVFAATLAGLILGTVAWKGRSLWPCVLFHLLFNGQQVLIGRAETGALGPVGDAWHWLLFADGAYRPVVLALCGAGTTALLIWLARYDGGGGAAATRSEPAGRGDAGIPRLRPTVAAGA